MLSAFTIVKLFFVSTSHTKSQNTQQTVCTAKYDRKGVLNLLSILTPPKGAKGNPGAGDSSTRLQFWFRLPELLTPSAAAPVSRQ